jgi:hypothetical protein
MLELLLAIVLKAILWGTLIVFLLLGYIAYYIYKALKYILKYVYRRLTEHRLNTSSLLLYDKHTNELEEF